MQKRSQTFTVTVNDSFDVNNRLRHILKKEFEDRVFFVENNNFELQVEVKIPHSEIIFQTKVCMSKEEIIQVKDKSNIINDLLITSINSAIEGFFKKLLALGWANMIKK